MNLIKKTCDLDGCNNTFRVMSISGKDHCCEPHRNLALGLDHHRKLYQGKWRTKDQFKKAQQRRRAYYLEMGR